MSNVLIKLTQCSPLHRRLHHMERLRIRVAFGTVQSEHSTVQQWLRCCFTVRLHGARRLAHVCPSGAHHCVMLSKCLICSLDSDLTSVQPPQYRLQPRSRLVILQLLPTVPCVFSDLSCFCGKYGFSSPLMQDFPLYILRPCRNNWLFTLNLTVHF